MLLNLIFWNFKIDYFMEIIMKDTVTNASCVKSQTFILYEHFCDLMLTGFVSV